MSVFLSPVLLGYEEFLSHIKTKTIPLPQMLLLRLPFLLVALYRCKILLDQARDRIRIQGLVFKGG